jgi:hypothetical protein
MTERLPLLSAQLAFGLYAQRAGQRPIVTLMFRTAPARLPAAQVREVLQSVVLRNPALSYRIRFSRGAAYQEWCPSECDFAELHAVSGDAVAGTVTEAIEEFVTSLDGPAMAGRLIRSPDGDTLLLVFDHALVDEQSLLLIKRQLAAPSVPDDDQLARYQAAITDRLAFEDAAGNGAGIKFWADRLEAAGALPSAPDRTPRVIPFHRLPNVAVPRSFRGSLFPYVLFSIHRALREVEKRTPTIVGYPWGVRNAAAADLVGCFMNSVISLDTSQTAEEFVGSWYQEIDHADVPFTAVAGPGSGFSGWVTTHLSYTHAADRAVPVAGVPTEQVALTRGRPPQACAFLAVATVRDDELELRLLLDELVAGYGADEFGARWHHWLSTAIASIPERKS